MKIGLALSGGVGRAAAHIGVLQGLIEAGIRPDIVAGSSAGALIGYGYCAGVSLRLWRELSYQIGWTDIASIKITSKGFVSFKPLEDWLVDLFGDLHFSDLQTPLIVAATDILTGETQYLHQGPVAPAVHASCSVPGFVEPVNLLEKNLVDGGASNNLPSSVLRKYSADYVIGVDLFQPSIAWHLGGLSYGVTGIEMLIRQSGGGLQECDILITPKLTGISYLQLGNSEELIRLGKKAAQEMIPKILQVMV